MTEQRRTSTSGIRLAFTPYDPTVWLQGDETSRTDCGWHAERNQLHTGACTGQPIWTIEEPGRKISACEKAGHDVLRQYGKRL